jgi:hypothetical protein
MPAASSTPPGPAFPGDLEANDVSAATHLRPDHLADPERTLAIVQGITGEYARLAGAREQTTACDVILLCVPEGKGRPWLEGLQAALQRGGQLLQAGADLDRFEAATQKVYATFFSNPDGEAQARARLATLEPGAAVDVLDTGAYVYTLAPQAPDHRPSYIRPSHARRLGLIAEQLQSPSVSDPPAQPGREQG